MSPLGVLVLVTLGLSYSSAATFNIPAPTIAIYNVGLKVSIPGSSGIELFIFHGRVNRVLKLNEPGEITGEVNSVSSDGRWTFLNLDKQLVIGDVIHYWIYVQHDGLGYRLDNQHFQVKEFDKESKSEITYQEQPLPPPPKCELSETKVNGEYVCRGSVIFEDNFDAVDFKKFEPLTRFSSDWEDAEFNSYQNRSENYYVRNGVLVIAPTLQTTVTGFDEQRLRTGKMDFGRTCSIDLPYSNPRDCAREAGKGYILPPVISAKLRTKAFFKFRYGEVTVRAKVPKGDWLFPELYLDSADRVYGPNFFGSGQMRIALVRGNTRLTSNGQDIDGTQLSGILVVSQDEKDRGKWTKTRAATTHWGNDFHNYTLTWTPTSISMAVDGQIYANFRDPFCSPPSLCETITHSSAWKNGLSMAPFDQEFYITIGVGVGGQVSFPDDSLNGVSQTAKPWANSDPQAERSFYGDVRNWQATWTEESVLQVDHIIVKAL